MNNSLKILHTADWHGEDSEIEECTKVLGSIVDHCRENHLTVSGNGLDLIIIAGDLTNSQNCKLDTLTTRLLFKTIQDLSDFAPVLIIKGTDSHDGFSPEIFAVLKNVTVSTVPEQLYLVGGNIIRNDGEVKIDAMWDIGAVISTVPSITKKYFHSDIQKDLSIEETDNMIGQAISQLFAGFPAMIPEGVNCPHILVGHWQVGGAYISETQQLIGRDIEVSTQQIALAQADLVCLGHIHKAQKIGENIFYSGDTYRQNFGEMDEKGFYVHDIHNNDQDLNSYEFILTPSRKLEKLEEDFTDDNNSLTIKGFSDAIDKHLLGDFSNTVVSLNLTIWRDDADKIDKAKIKEEYLAVGATKCNVNVIYVPRENVRSERLLKITSLPEKLEERASILEEDIPEGVLVKSNDLQNMNPERIIEECQNL